MKLADDLLVGRISNGVATTATASTLLRQERLLALYRIPSEQNCKARTSLVLPSLEETLIVASIDIVFSAIQWRYGDSCPGGVPICAMHQMADFP